MQTGVNKGRVKIACDFATLVLLLEIVVNHTSQFLIFLPEIMTMVTVLFWNTVYDLIKVKEK